MLQIQKIQLNNFGIHKELTLDFLSGVNAISGMNSVGKSTIITSIGFALFNHNSQSNQARLIHSTRATGKVEIDFTLNGFEYNIIRSIGTSNYVVLTFKDEEGKEKKIYSSKDVYKKMSEILETTNPESIFQNILSIKSREIVAPFTADLQTRRQFFIGSLGLQKYEEVWSALRPVISNLEGRISSTSDSKEKGVSIRKRISSLKVENRVLESVVESKEKLLTETLEKAVGARALKERYEDELKEKYKYQAVLDNYNSKKKSLLSRLSGIESQLNKLEKSSLKVCPTCGQTLDNEAEKQYNETKKRELTQTALDLEAQLAETNQLISNVTSTLLEYGDYDYEYKLYELDSEVSELQKDIEISKHKIELNKTSIETYSEDIKHILTALRKHNSAKKSVSLVSSIREGMRTISSTVNLAMIEDISLIGSQFLSELRGTNCRIEIQNNYNIVVHMDGDNFEFTQLSDGVQVMTGLAIRLAMTRFCSDLGIVFLDEPTINLHSDVKSSLLEAIKNLGFNQIFVISHDDTFVSATDNLIRLGEKESG